MKTLAMLIGEHAAIREMIARFEAEIDAIEDRGAVDAEALGRLLGFFEEQIDGHHQEKEERVFLPRLLTRAHGWDAVLVRSLLDDHASQRKLLAAMRCEIDKAAYGEPNSLAILARTARRYVEHQHRHSRWEELVIFPLARRILKLLNEDGYTIRGVQQLLSRGGDPTDADPPPAAPPPPPAVPVAPTPETQHAPFPAEELRALRRALVDALFGVVVGALVLLLVTVGGRAWKALRAA